MALEKPIIVTFYSFKGGVGRSMALLNVACFLAKARQRILLVDFDLEAPGLTCLIRREKGVSEAGDAPETAGVVDLLHEYLYSPETWAFHPKVDEPDLASFITSMEIPGVETDSPGSLHLMPVGRTREYGKRLESLAMGSGDFRKIRKAFASRFRQVLLESGLFDYIFIDARTGMSDEGYIACKFLCDHLVVLSGLNEQNIEGTGYFLRKVAEWKDSRESSLGKLVLMASPVCEHEDEEKRRRFAEATARLNEITGTRVEFSDFLPYHPRLSLYEEIIVLLWPESGLGRAYRRLAEVVRGLSSDRFEDWSE